MSNESKTSVRAGDVVYHRPSKERWVVAAVSPTGEKLACCGWPESIAEVADCDIIEDRRATDSEHIERLEKVIAHCFGQLRGSWARQELARTKAGGA